MVTGVLVRSARALPVCTGCWDIFRNLLVVTLRGIRMIEPEKILSSLPSDSLEALSALIGFAKDNLSDCPDEYSYDIMCDWLVFIGTFIEMKDIDYKLDDVSGDEDQDYRTYRYLVDEVGPEALKRNRALRAQRKRAEQKLLFPDQFHYSFNEGEQGRIQKILNELRDHVLNSSLFEIGHKQRLLFRLEALQAELHKKLSDLDRFWGLLGDAGIAIGKFGSDAKPFVDRIKDLTGLVWRAQAKAEALEHDAEHPLLLGQDE